MQSRLEFHSVSVYLCRLTWDKFVDEDLGSALELLPPVETFDPSS